MKWYCIFFFFYLISQAWPEHTIFQGLVSSGQFFFYGRAFFYLIFLVKLGLKILYFRVWLAQLKWYVTWQSMRGQQHQDTLLVLCQNLFLGLSLEGKFSFFIILSYRELYTSFSNMIIFIFSFFIFISFSSCNLAPIGILQGV